VFGRGNVIFLTIFGLGSFSVIFCGWHILGRVHRWHFALPCPSLLSGWWQGVIILLYTYIGGLYDRRHSSEILNDLIARMIIMIIIRKRPPLVTGLALLTSQLRGLLEKRATYAVRRPPGWRSWRTTERSSSSEPPSHLPIHSTYHWHQTNHQLRHHSRMCS